MAKFKYTAIDANGKQKTGTVEAASQDEASSKLSASGLMPTKITNAGGGATAKAASKKGGKKSKKSSTFIITRVLRFSALRMQSRLLNRFQKN